MIVCIDELFALGYQFVDFGLNKNKSVVEYKVRGGITSLKAEFAAIKELGNGRTNDKLLRWLVDKAIF